MLLGEPERSSFDLKFPLGPIPVRISPWFWGIAALLGLRLPGQLIPIWVACVFVGVLVHELGHALTARAFGARDVHIVLYGMGGLSIGTHRLPRWQRVLELFAGPGAGFALFGALYAGTSALGGLERVGNLHAAVAIEFLMTICLFWGVINLLPVHPLDGGQIARELLTKVRPRDGLRLSLQLSLVIAAGVAGYALYSRELFGAFLFGSLAYSSWQALQQLGRGGGWGEGPREPWEQDPDAWKR